MPGYRNLIVKFRQAYRMMDGFNDRRHCQDPGSVFNCVTEGEDYDCLALTGGGQEIYPEFTGSRGPLQMTQQ